MKAIEGRVPEIMRELHASGTPDNSADRQRSVTSAPSGNSTGKAGETASEITGKGISFYVKPPPVPMDVENAVEKLNEFVQSQKTNVSFSVDEDAKATVIKVFKSETGELIRQFPPEEILAMKAKINQTVGLLYDVKV
ncbi:MAG: flagellar protein FlaG [Candidatus Latescibacterota bacterium]